MIQTIDINCDMGESFGNWRLGDDARLLPSITTANVACGFHGGDPVTMLRTVETALAASTRFVLICPTRGARSGSPQRASR